MGKRLRGPYMNLSVRTFALLFALILIHGCTGKDDASTSQQNTEGNAITQEEDLIVTTLNNVANAESQFSKTKDSASILRFYAQGYAGIKDGKSETVKDQKNYLAEVLEQINSDEPIGISSKVMNIKPSVAGRFGWATYEYEYKVGRSGGRSGVLQQVSQGQCTAIFTKQADAWLIRHEHCSTVNPTPFFLTPR
jgi:ketosteroid isomerase-like protein